MPFAATIGILAAGGDCPGLDGGIRAAVKTAFGFGYDCIGFVDGDDVLVGPVAYLPLDGRNTADSLFHCVTNAPTQLST